MAEIGGLATDESCEQNGFVFQNASEISKTSLTQAQVRKIRTISSLLKVMKHIENAKIWLITALVYIDRLCEKDDVIPISMLQRYRHP
jgi:hypothetical protein